MASGGAGAARQVSGSTFEARAATVKVPSTVVLTNCPTARDRVGLKRRIVLAAREYGELQRVIVEAAKAELDSAGIETLQPQQVVRVIPPDSDPSRSAARDSQSCS